PSFGTISTTNSSGTMYVVINNTFSTINLFDFHVQSDLANLIETLQQNDTDIRVVVFSSGNKDFFIAHVDSPLPLFDSAFPDMLFSVALLWNITQLPLATIAVIEGRARGIGNEFLMSCDMRFATTSPSVLFAQLEPSVGIVPGAGCAMYLVPLIGRGRAFEYVLSATDLDAQNVVWINCAFDTSKELHDYVQTFAARMTLFPAAGIAGTKAGINAVSKPQREVIAQYAQGVILRLALLERFVVASNNQSIGPLKLEYGREVLLFLRK
ncbi:ClpP/crotonase-like domain-containing protein, partial [Mycena capillaripes]